MATDEMVRDAIEAGNLPAALRMAKQLKDPLKLADAAKLLQLMATSEQGDADLFERSAVKWVQRLTVECKKLKWQNLLIAVQAVEVIDVDPRALPTLIEISYRPHRHPPDLAGIS
jgi:hypothetical protein